MLTEMFFINLCRYEVLQKCDLSTRFIRNDAYFLMLP